MAKIEKKPTFKANIGYSGHDVSRDLATSSPLSMLLPFYCDFLSPGDKVNFSTTMFTRTEPLVKPAFVRVHEHVDWFFVPIEQLYSLFGNVFYGIQDVSSSMFTLADIQSTFPTFSPTMLEGLLFDNYGIDTAPADLVYSDWSKSRDGMNVPHIHSALRLAQCLGLTTKLLDPVHETADLSRITAHQPTAFFLAAYQKIFMDYYRLDDWEANDPTYYSLDKFYNGSFVAADTLKKLFTVHYAPLNKDYFTNVMPSPLVGASSVSGLANGLNSGLVNVQNWQGGGTSSLLRLLGLDSVGNTGTDNINPTTIGAGLNNGPSISQMFSTANMRGMFALEKLLEVTRRAGKHYDKQTLAHFGVEVPKGIAGEVYYLGSDNNEIDFNEVVSTANTASADSGSALGALAGKGIGASRNDKKSFTAPCHGILMAIHYQKADTYYSLDSHFDKLNAITESVDLYHPEFDNLGMQPVFGYEQEYSPFGLLAGDGADTWNNTITAWQYRYSQYKTKYDVVGGKLLYGDDTAWIPTRNWGFYTQNVNRYYQNPQFLDGIFKVAFNFSDTPTPQDAQGLWSKRDNFSHYMRFNVYKASKMSTYSLPKLNG